MARNADFLSNTKEIILKRSAYRCNFLGCGKTVVGPGKSFDSFESKSLIAHIFAAEEGGARGTGGLSVEKRKSSSNGILMCADHGRIIDCNNGKDYPASLLISWKDIHENKVLNELDGYATQVSYGWLESVEFLSSPIFKKSTLIKFGKVNLIYGKEGTGKSFFCEWISALLGNYEAIDRIRILVKNLGKPIAMNLIYHNPHKNKMEVNYDGKKLGCFINEQPTFGLSHSFKCIFMREESSSGPKGSEDHLSYFVRKFGIHPFEMKRILESLDGKSLGYVTKFRCSEKEDDDVDESDEDKDDRENEDEASLSIHVQAAIGSGGLLLGYHMLSGREKSQVDLMIGIRIAELYSKYISTVLIIELEATFLPEKLLDFYTKLLAGSEYRFQTIFTTRLDRKVIDWSGWQAMKFVGSIPNIQLVQDGIFE